MYYVLNVPNSLFFRGTCYVISDNVMFSHNSSINVVFLFAALNSFWSELWALNHWGILVTNDPKHGFSTCGQQLYHWNFSGEWFVFKTGCIKFCYQWLLVYSLNFKLWNILWKSGNQSYMMHSFDSLIPSWENIFQLKNQTKISYCQYFTELHFCLQL